MLLSLKTPDSSGNPATDLVPPSGIPKGLTGGLNSTQNLLQLGIELLVLAGVILSVIVFMISGIQWITSAGNPAKVAAAKKRLFFALLGIIVMSGAFFAVRVIIGLLGGDPSKFLSPGSLLQQ